MLNSEQNLYLAVYLHTALVMSVGLGGELIDDVPPSVDAIRLHLKACKTREALYDYLEDFAFICDPLFLIFLDTLLDY